MFTPGLTQDALLLHYRDALQPQATLDLLQALLDLGCVKKRTVVCRPKASLFSRSSTRAQSGTEDAPGTVFYEPTLSCVLRLSHVLPNERLWSTAAAGP